MTPRAKKPAAEQEAAFDASEYDDPELRLDYIDGKPVDRIVVRFAGSVELDRRNRECVELFRRFQLGHRIDFNAMPPLSAVVKQKPSRQVTDAAGTVGDVVTTAVLSIDTIGGLGKPVKEVSGGDGGASTDGDPED